MASIGLPGDYQPCGCNGDRPVPKPKPIHARTARGVVHALTVDRIYTTDGRHKINRPGSATGKADCGAITSGAATLTTDPVTCPRCLAKA